MVERTPEAFEVEEDNGSLSVLHDHTELALAYGRAPGQPGGFRHMEIWTLQQTLHQHSPRLAQLIARAWSYT